MHEQFERQKQLINQDQVEKQKLYDYLEELQKLRSPKDLVDFIDQQEDENPLDYACLDAVSTPNDSQKLDDYISDIKKNVIENIDPLTNMEPSSFVYERTIMNNSKMENAELDSKDYENFKSFDIVQNNSEEYIQIEEIHIEEIPSKKASELSIQIKEDSDKESMKEQGKRVSFTDNILDHLYQD